MAVEAANLIGQYLPDGDQLDVRYQNLAGAGGITASNYMNNARADGSTISVTTRGPLLNNPIVSPEQVKYDPLDFRYPAAARSFTRSIAISHHTQDVTDHFQWSWDRFIDEAPDLRFAFLGVGHGSHVFGSLYHHFHPDLDLDTANAENFLHYGGGGEARAAIERGEADVYQGSFSGQYANDEFYYTQFVATDERFEDSFNRGMYEVDERAVTLADTDLAQDEVRKIVDMVQDGQLFQLPPGTSDEVYDIWVDAIDQLFQDDDWLAAMSNIAGDTPLNLFFSPQLEFDDVIASGWQTRQDLEDLLEDLF